MLGMTFCIRAVQSQVVSHPNLRSQDRVNRCCTHDREQRSKKHCLYQHKTIQARIRLRSPEVSLVVFACSQHPSPPTKSTHLNGRAFPSKLCHVTYFCRFIRNVTRKEHTNTPHHEGHYHCRSYHRAKHSFLARQQQRAETRHQARPL